MKKSLLIVFMASTLIVWIAYYWRAGCGTLLSIIFEMLSWKIVKSVSSAAFSDTHQLLTSFLAAVLASACLALLLWVVIALAQRRGHLLSPSAVTKAFAVGAALYLVMLLVAFPMEKCM